MRQAFIIAGWTPSLVRARPFASLILAQREQGKLVQKGKVGTGFDAETMADLARRFATLELDELAFEIDRATAAWSVMPVSSACAATNRRAK